MAHIGPPFTSLVGSGGSSGGGSAQQEIVLVSTGNEARPAGPVILWIGGTARPTNYGANDVWFPSA